jgi:16S rRNA (cytidine1402-2'-O)-methyltransferase
MSDLSGRLLIAGTPIGNPGDATTRLREALETTPVIAAEDTRRLQRLTASLGIRYSGSVLSFFEGNEQQRTPELIEILVSGRDVLLVTDAGMPSVSDPGFRLVRAALDRGVPITVLPGPSAVLAALVLSGLPVDRFAFDGFAPRTKGARQTWARSLAGETRTVVFFESPHRLGACLADLAAALGEERPAAVCRELTKTYEEVIRGSLPFLSQWAVENEVLGEITVVIAGKLSEELISDPSLLARAVIQREAAGVSRKEAIAEIAAENGIAKRLVYDAVVAGKERP